ncbi:putative transcriptional regulatory protein [Lachnellula hyalina]|uniref:Putative transcriptional regulatory protein n=1 Tax=Lachnellula hyalina TaxID=1316788 RepID=A0A8H8QYL5_9HELO|nr:putative transcriptional regulatory protein [Lachnellula hyalina]TVY25243.1 putative transcriptional regulatory protein [Lachnellula hyalina]
MNDPEPNVASTEDSAASSTIPLKPLSWPRNPRTSKTEAYFDEMENRIKRMESAIIAPEVHGTTEPVERKEEEKSSDKIESQAELSNHLSNLVIDPSGSPNFIGWASGFSLFSPQGVRWISERVGDKDELAQLAQTMSKHDYGVWGRADGDLWYPTPRSQHSPLPPKDLASQYVNCFFITFNNVFPIVSRKVFNSYFERQYSANPPASTAWYALFNAVLCLGSIRTEGERDMHVRGSCLIDYTSNDQETGVEYFRNASSCFHELFFNEASLMAMQAMTLMLYITRSSPNPQPAYTLTCAAGNLANTLGLHRRLDCVGLAAEELEQRRNVFWVFYLMEKAISHNLGRPSVITDDDIAIDLPPKKPGLIQSPSGAKVHDIFQDQITLAIIKSRIYTELYSASSQTKSESDRMKVLAKLDNHLQRWRDAMPIDIRPEHPIRCSDEQYVPVVMMHFIYLDAIILLHRLSGHQEASKIPRSDTTDMKSRHASQVLCLAAARHSIQLLHTFSSNNLQNQHIMWFVTLFQAHTPMALYYPLSASLVLFAHILSNPQTHHQHDIQLMNQLTSFINAAVQPGSSFAATPTLSMFQALYGIATRFVAKAHASGNIHLPQSSLSRNGRTKTRMPGDENADDFDLHPDTTQTQTQPVSSSRAQPLPDESSSLYSDLNLTSNTQPTTLPEEIIPEPSHSPTTIDTSPLNFAPFLPDQTYDYPMNMNMNLNSTYEWNWDMNIDMNMDDMDMNIKDIDMSNTWMSSALNPNPDSDLWATTEGDNLSEANQEFVFRPDVI